MAKKTIFITGGGAGIGRATAELFASRGYVVGLGDVDRAAAEATRDALGSVHYATALDVRDPVVFGEALAAFDAHTGGTGELSVLFNCAGVLRMGKFEEISLEDCRLQLDVNVMGVLHGVRAALPYLERAKGTVVSMGSASAIYGQPELAMYSASKFAVRALTEALDLELKSRGVRVTDVMPSYVATGMVSSQKTPAKSLGRLGVRITPEQVAAKVYAAVQGSAVHYPMPFDFAFLARVATLSPALTRFVTRLLTT